MLRGLQLEGLINMRFVTVKEEYFPIPIHERRENQGQIQKCEWNGVENQSSQPVQRSTVSRDRRDSEGVCHGGEKRLVSNLLTPKKIGAHAMHQ